MESAINAKILDFSDFVSRFLEPRLLELGNADTHASRETAREILAVVPSRLHLNSRLPPPVSACSTPSQSFAPQNPAFPPL